MTSLTETPSTCERIILQTGFGLYHYFIIGLASACAFAQADTITTISFAIPLATCDLGLPKSTLTLTFLAFTLGTIIGGYLICVLIDLSGRRHMVPITLLIVFIGIFSCAFIHEVVMTVICVALSAAGLAGNIASVKIILGEILPMHSRGFYLVLPDLFWTVGYISTTAIDWLVTPSIIGQQSMGLRVITWRVIFGLGGLCCTAVACATALVEQSPRYLMLRKEYMPALITLKHVFAVNTSRHTESFAVAEAELHSCIDDYGTTDENRQRSCRILMKTNVKRMHNLTMQLFREKFLVVTVLLIAIKTLLPFGIMNINIWLAKMLQNRNETACTFSTSDALYIESVHNMCKMDSDALYRDYFLIALSIFSGKIFTLITIDRCGRIISIITGCVISAIASFALAFVSKAYFVELALSLVIMGGYSITDSILAVLLVEVYPTVIRGTAAGLIPILPNLMAIIMHFAGKMECEMSLFMFSAASLVVAGMSWFLPELSKRPMVE